MNKIGTLVAVLLLSASAAMAQDIGLYLGTDCNPGAVHARRDRLWRM